MRTTWNGVASLAMLLIALSAGSAGSAAAAPAKLPMVTVPCLPDDPTVTAAGDEPVVCWDGGCMKPDLSGTGAALVAAPTPVPAWTAVATVNPDAVCLGRTCKPLKPKLRAAVAAARKSDPTARIQATTDLAAVVVDGAVWSVARDAALALKAPGDYKDSPGEIAGVSVAGDLLVVDWSDCAGPCTRAQLVDTRGKNRGPSTEGGGQVIQLGARRFALVSEYANVEVFDAHTGKARGSATVNGDAGASHSAVRLGDSELAILIGRGDGYHLMTFEVDDGGRVMPRGERYLPACAP